MSRFTKRELEQASEMWKSGQTYKDLMPFLNVTKRRFNELCKRRRDLFPKRYEGPPVIDIDKAVELWKAGLSMDNIADAIGVKKHVVHRLVREDVGGVFPPRALIRTGFTFEVSKAGNPMTPHRIDQAAELWAQGLLAKEIAERIGVTIKQFERVRLAARDRFPYRSNRMLAHAMAMTTKVQEPVVMRDDVMLWKTFSGINISLPRVSILADRM